jgi:acyl-CoA synthetase (AMP-forming)/AMP-acid ligase II
MIKSAGNRISPKEIESTISEIEAVVNAVVIGVSDELLGEVPKAIVVLGKKDAITSDEIITYCRKKLATYKIPKHVLIVNSLPQNSSGKVDVKKIKEMYGKDE